MIGYITNYPFRWNGKEKPIIAMNRAITLTIVGLLVASTVMAAPRRRSAAVMLSEARQHVANPTLAATEGDIQLYTDPQEGFVLLSATEGLPAVLGYGTSRLDPDNMPEPVQWLIAYYDALSQDISAGHLAPAKTYKPTTVVAPLLTTLWGQRAPYNGMCPPFYNETTQKMDTSYVGCPSTAFSQIMYYHRWPEHGTGTVLYRCTVLDTTITADLSQSTYDWDHMRTSYNGTETQQERDAVALLCRDVGYAVNMQYEKETGSGSTDYEAALGFVKYMGYDKGLRLLTAAYYDNDTWCQILETELAAGRPVKYDGNCKGKDGHAFIIDGVNADGLFHVNWGWYGDANDYFYITSLTPTRGGVTGYFSDYMTATIGIQKPVEGSAYMPYELTISTYECRDVDTDAMVANRIYVQYSNIGYDSFTGKLHATLVSEDGSTKYDDVMSINLVNLDRTHSEELSYPYNIPSSVPDGKYRLTFYSVDSNGNRRDVLMQCKNLLTISSGKVVYEREPYEIINVRVVPDTERNGCFTIWFTIHNTGTETIAKSCVTAECKYSGYTGNGVTPFDFFNLKPDGTETDSIEGSFFMPEECTLSFYDRYDVPLLKNPIIISYDGNDITTNITTAISSIKANTEGSTTATGRGNNTPATGKQLRNGQIVIRRNGREYNAAGARLR